MITKNGELEIIFPDEYDSTKIVLLKDNVMIVFDLYILIRPTLSQMMVVQFK